EEQSAAVARGGGADAAVCGAGKRAEADPRLAGPGAAAGRAGAMTVRAGDETAATACVNATESRPGGGRGKREGGTARAAERRACCVSASGHGGAVWGGSGADGTAAGVEEVLLGGLSAACLLAAPPRGRGVTILEALTDQALFAEAFAGPSWD